MTLDEWNTLIDAIEAEVPEHLPGGAYWDLAALDSWARKSNRLDTVTANALGGLSREARLAVTSWFVFQVRPILSRSGAPGRGALAMLGMIEDAALPGVALPSFTPGLLLRWPEDSRGALPEYIHAHGAVCSLWEAVTEERGPESVEAALLAIHGTFATLAWERFNQDWRPSERRGRIMQQFVESAAYRLHHVQGWSILCAKLRTLRPVPDGPDEG